MGTNTFNTAAYTITPTTPFATSTFALSQTGKALTEYDGLIIHYKFKSPLTSTYTKKVQNAASSDIGDYYYLKNYPYIIIILSPG